MSFIGSTINDSPTINGKATAAIANGAFLAVAFDGNGGVVKAGAGANAIGILIDETPENVSAGGDVTIQIKDIGLWRVGAAVAKGAELSCDANGKAITAATGKFITAVALDAATAADQIIRVQICKSGYKA